MINHLPKDQGKKQGKTEELSQGGDHRQPTNSMEPGKRTFMEKLMTSQ